MRTNIEIDGKLMKQAMTLCPGKTMKAIVEESLVLAVKLHRQRKALDKLRGIGWEGDLDAMRRQRFPDWDNTAEKQPDNVKISAA